jgi:hypothetical protein
MKYQLLRKLLEWRIEIDHNWSWKPGATGRGLKKHLPSETWEQEAEGRHLFRLYWVLLVPKPKLIEGQDAWLDRVYDALLCSTGTGCQSTRASK